jgi:hypothetical protein
VRVNIQKWRDDSVEGACARREVNGSRQRDSQDHKDSTAPIQIDTDV